MISFCLNYHFFCARYGQLLPLDLIYEQPPQQRLLRALLLQLPRLRLVQMTLRLDVLQPWQRLKQQRMRLQPLKLRPLPMRQQHQQPPQLPQ